jgi:very-short-patch-repair endonuclease
MKRFSTRKLPPQLLERCRELRGSQTKAETRLWWCLRRKQLFGARFRRQHPLGGYILDFYCPELKLTVELDGGGHAQDNQKCHDEQRTEHLIKYGVTVLRFWNNDVFSNLEGVLLKIAEYLPEPPSLTLPPEGGGDMRNTPRT